MRTRSDVIDACMQLGGAFEDYPFDDPNWTCMRHGGNKKVFAFICERNGVIWINVKAEPLKADFWRDAFDAVQPAYHMNKRHWVSIILDGSMQDEDVMMLIKDSYELTKGKRKAGRV